MPHTCWSTTGVPAHDVRRFWIETVHREICELGIDIDARSEFHADLRGGSAGRISFNRIAVHGTQIVRRTGPMIARCTRPRYSILTMRSGGGQLRHRGMEIPLRLDECVILDNRDPYEITVSGHAESVSFFMPADWVEGYLPDVDSAVARPLPVHRPWVRVLMNSMEAIESLGGTENADALTEQHFGSTLSLAVGRNDVARSRHTRNTFRSLQRSLGELAFTRNVTASDLARAHGISLRYVHTLFAAYETTFGNELIRMRLERARTLLTSERFASLSIDEISWQCGFSDASHFRRRFRARFGVTPSASRRGRHTDPAVDPASGRDPDSRSAGATERAGQRRVERAHA